MAAGTDRPTESDGRYGRGQLPMFRMTPPASDSGSKALRVRVKLCLYSPGLMVWVTLRHEVQSVVREARPSTSTRRLGLSGRSVAHHVERAGAADHFGGACGLGQADHDRLRGVVVRHAAQRLHLQRITADGCRAAATAD